MKIQNIILALICLLSLSACDYDWYSTANLYTQNETNSEYLVYVRYEDTVGIYRSKNLKSVVLPYQKSQLIQSMSYVVPYSSESPLVSIPYGYIYILNRKDSTYFKFRTTEYNKFDPTAYFYSDYTKDLKNRIGITNYNVTINDSLVSKMVKDKLVADSIMNIWY